MKKNIFPKIIYYIFTFALGVLLAFGLYGYHAVFEVPQKVLADMNQYLVDGSYDKAMELVGGYFNREYVFQQSFEDGVGIVLFEAATPTNDPASVGSSEDDSKPAMTKMHKSYAGFIYGLKGLYDVVGESDNQTRLVVTNLDNVRHVVTLIDTDMDSNDVKDSISTMTSQGLIFLDLDLDTHTTLSKLEFYDAKGNVFRSIELNLDYSGVFFTDVNEFYEEYNRDYKSEKLIELSQTFLSKNDNYGISIESPRYKETDVKGILIVVAYFVVIYIIADFLVGRRYILKLCRWLHYKTPWGKKAAQKRPVNKEVFGHDYYSQVTMSLDLSELPDFNESVQVRYTNTDVEISFILMKDNGYTVTERIKAGTYVNAWMEINKDYAPVDMPENLIVEGYKMDVKIKILKRKEESV